MRVGIVLEQLVRSTSGGTGRFTREIATALVAGQGSDDVVTGWATFGSSAVTGRRGPQIAGAHTRHLMPPHPLLVPRLWERGLGRPPRNTDVVFAPTVLAPPRRPRGPAVVATIHDAVPWTAPETMSPRGLAFHRRMIARIADSADAVVVPTVAVAAQLAEHVPQLRGELVHVIGEGVSAAIVTVPPDADAVARSFDLPPAYLLMVGTFEPRKGIDVAIAAMADPAMPHLPLLVVGQPGWGEIDPRRLAEQHGIPDGCVRVLPDVDDRSLPVLYDRASALLAPSRDEGFGLPVAEAMAHGTPVVISDVPALVETAGGAAEIVPVADAAALAAAAARAAEPAYRTAHSAALRAAAGRHSWPAAAERLWTVLRSVATTTSQP